MVNFRFVHAADLHLDSPLIGLAKKSEDCAARLDDASRRAFDNLIALAIEEDCRLIVIAGDIFDGQWRDYRTGLFFVDRMRRLRQASIRVIIIAGNHDAENRFAGRLEYSDNVRLLSQRNPESVVIEELGVVVHGQSFPQRDVVDNIASEYPSPVPGRFNIGLLHTACGGSEGHASYAPCTVEQLVNHGYQYWALGHVHTRQELSKVPYIVYPGNLQGRSVRETGPKGATLVEVADGGVTRIEHRALDVVRWTVEDVTLTGMETREALLPAVRESIERAFSGCDGRALAMRLCLVGATLLHAELAATAPSVREEIETLAAGIASDIWIEKVEVRTSPAAARADVDPTVAGRLRQAVERLAADPWLAERLEALLAEIKIKLPAGAQSDTLFHVLRTEVPERARTLALATIDRGQG
ncbi:MAG: metallophosphoesterase family protein [Methylocella sp.]|nr:MAG: DNA repair exonuclease [Hyphomicrobiales bacterium]